MTVPPACAYEDSCFCRAMCSLPMVRPPSTTRMARSVESDIKDLASAALLAETNGVDLTHLVTERLI